jgi:hypothetical protein
MNLTTSSISWKYSLNKWIGLNKNLYSYDSNGKHTSSVFSLWDETKNDWFESEKTNCSYFSNGTLANYENLNYSKTSRLWFGSKSERIVTNEKDTVSIGYQWNSTSNTWENMVKYEYSYDGAGNKILEIDYLWDVAQKNWLQVQKWEITYNGNTSTELLFFMNNTSLNWDTVSKKFITKSADGKHETFTSYNWNSINSAWDEYKKVETTYNSKGIILNTISFIWNGTSWEEEGNKQAFIYDSNTRPLNYTFWLNNSTAYKQEYTYDGRGNNLKDIFYQWDSQTSNWRLSSKYEYTYDTNNNLTSLIYSSVNEDKSSLNIVGKYFYTFNSDNAKVYSVYYYWDNTSNKFIKSNSNKYFNSKNYITQVRNTQFMNTQIENHINESVAKGMSPKKAFEIYAK